MKTVKILFWAILGIMFFQVNINADEKIWDAETERSISLYMEMQEEGLFIHSDEQYDQVNLQVVDANGFIIYVDLINIPAEEALIISLPDLPEGDYQVILSKNNQPVVWYITK